jgi:putative peptidoglycan lipid II flippase
MSLGRAIAVIAAPTMLSRVLGFVRDMAVAAVIGAGPVADAFFIAFKLPNFFRRLFAEGAFASAFVPLFAGELQAGGRDAARDFAREAQVALLVVLLPFVALLIAAMPVVMRLLAPGLRDEPATLALAIDLGRITFPYLLFISLVSLYGGVLNGLGRFAHVAAAPILLNLALLAALFALTPVLPNGGYALAIGVFVAGVLQFAWLFAICARQDMTPWLVRPRFGPRIGAMWRLIVPAAIGGGAMQVNLMLDVVWASFMPAGAISALYYADRVSQLPLGVVGVAIGTALLPMLARAVRAEDRSGAMDHQNRAIEVALLLALPAAAALFVLAEPIVRVLFQRGAFGPVETARTAAALAAFAIGLPGFVLVKALAPGFYARRDARTPLYIGLACIAVSVAANVVFLLWTGMQHVGIALATSISGLLNAALMAMLLSRRGNLAPDDRLLRRMPRIVLATAIMTAAVWGAARLLAAPLAGTLGVRTLSLVALCTFGALVYGAAAWLLGILRTSELTQALRRRPGLEPAAADGE